MARSFKITKSKFYLGPGNNKQSSIHNKYLIETIKSLIELLFTFLWFLFFFLSYLMLQQISLQFSLQIFLFIGYRNRIQWIHILTINPIQIITPLYCRHLNTIHSFLMSLKVVKVNVSDQDDKDQDKNRILEKIKKELQAPKHINTSRGKVHEGRINIKGWIQCNNVI